MVRFALRRPITILVFFLAILLFSVMAIRTIPIDIFPKLNSPTIYVIEQYGGMSAQQMEGFFATRMQDQFLYINGVKNVESKNIQGLTLIKLSFYESTDMAEASAQVALQVNRTRHFFRRVPCLHRLSASTHLPYPWVNWCSAVKPAH